MSILTDAVSPAKSVKVATATLYSALRPTVHADGMRFQLVERVSDGERFVITSRKVKTGELVDAINDRNRKRFEIDGKLKALPEESKRSAAQLREAEALAESRKDLPKIDADRSDRVARALTLYAASE